MRPDGSSFYAIHPESHRGPGSAFRSAMLLVAAALLAILPGIDSLLGAQSPPHTSQAAPDKRAGTLKLVVILSRHGVRSPAWTQARLNAYSVQPWPVWPVPPGYLTSRGYELMKLFGSFDRASLAHTGLLAAQGCSDAPKTYIWVDTDQRTTESGHALAEGLFPGCPPAVHGLAAGAADPLFHPAEAGLITPAADAARAIEPSDSQPSELLDEMQHVLLGCSVNGACTPARAPEILLLGDPAPPAHSRSDPMSESSEPLGAASSFAEDFLLEYADGMPMDRVGWGNVDEAQLRRFLALHSQNFERTHRTTAAARREASNMLFHIVRTLQQGVEQRPVADAVGPVASKVVVLVGHDTNLAGVAALLGLHWTLDGRANDTPPGTELAFELWQDDHGAYSVRVTVAMQTLRQMREVQDLTIAAPPARQTLTLQGCGMERRACAWEDFQHMTAAAIDAKAVFPEKSNRP